MDFQWWMVLPLIPLALLSFLAFKVWRIRRQARPFLALTRAERVQFARLILRDKDLPVVPRVVVGLAAAYLALPLDVIPDFVPVIGHADDFLVVTLLMAVITRSLPPGSLEAAVSEARREAAFKRALPVN